MNYKNNEIARSLTEMGFTEFTEIQQKSIPLIEAGKDMIGHSQTGTGKTAAFTIPFLEKIDYDSDKVQGLVICPTRELAVQVRNEMRRIGKYVANLRTLAVFGGQSVRKQIKALKKKPHIIVGTPGRLLDFVNRRLIRLEGLKYLVLDEADEMMKMGFIDDIETIISNADPSRQTVMFSATMPNRIVGITKKYMKQPEVVSVISGVETNVDITQYYYKVSEKNKIDAVGRLLKVYDPKRTLIFCNTKRKVDKVTMDLAQKGYNANKIHGDLPQTTRMQVLKSFHHGALDVLVGTDVAARGLDIKNVEVVINFDVPEKAEFYVHRIGRTGRIGNKGTALMMVSKRDIKRVKDIERFTKLKIKKRNIPTPDKMKTILVKKQQEDIQEIINKENLKQHHEMAYDLLNKHEPVELVSALLKTISKDVNVENKNDNLNESFNQTHDNSSSGDETRYHFNVGRKDGIQPKDFVQVIRKKTSLNNSQINDVIISKKSSFFSAPSKKHNQIMKSLTNIFMGNKKTSIQIAKGKPKSKRRRRRSY